MRIMRAALAGAVALSTAAIFVPSASAQSAPARIHLIHGIPATDVDVEVGGQNVFTGFKFGETKDLSSFAGQTLAGLKVKAAGTSTVAIDAGNVALPASGNYTVLANLDASGTPKLSVFQNDTSAIAAGKGRLVVRHTAAAPSVDIRANGAVAFAGVVNGQEGKADLDAGTVSADVVAAGTSGPAVIGPANLSVKNGESLIVYAVGSLANNSLTVLTESITGLGATPAAVQTGNSPVDDGGSSLPLVAALLGSVIVAGSATLLVRRQKA